MVKVSFSSYFRSINEFHQGSYRYITSLLYHKNANRKMWSRNLLMPFFWLDSIDIRTPNKNMEVERATISRMSSKLTHKQISLKRSVAKEKFQKSGGALSFPPTFVEGSGNAEQNALFCRVFIQKSVKRLKWSFIFLTWSFFMKNYFRKKNPTLDVWLGSKYTCE